MLKKGKNKFKTPNCVWDKKQVENMKKDLPKLDWARRDVKEWQKKTKLNQ